jgi:hypothetical protein
MDQAGKYRRLDSQRIIETVRELQERVQKRFPGSGLSQVIAELQRVAEENVARTDWIQKPHMPLRFVAGFLTLIIVAVLFGLLYNIPTFRIGDYAEFIQTFEASISSVVFVSAAVIFLVSWENRIKRERALKAIHELRAISHIVDMHQLTKDPESYFSPDRVALPPTHRAMTPFELNRYLDYCGDSLALISKIAALYAQGFQDPVLLDAVDEVESLTSGFSRKIWQKITLLENMGRALHVETSATPPVKPAS